MSCVMSTAYAYIWVFVEQRLLKSTLKKMFYFYTSTILTGMQVNNIKNAISDALLDMPVKVRRQ